MISSVENSHAVPSTAVRGKAKEKPKSLKDLLARHNQAPGNQSAEDYLADGEPPTTEEMKDMLQEAFLDVKDHQHRPSKANPSGDASTSLLRNLDDFSSAFHTDDVSVAFSEVEWKDRENNNKVPGVDAQRKSSKSKPVEQFDPASLASRKSKVASKDAIDKKRKTLKKKVTAEDLGLTEDEFKDPVRLQEALKRWAKDQGKTDDAVQQQESGSQVKPTGRIRVGSRNAVSAEDSMTVRRRSKSRGRPLVLPDQPTEGDRNRHGSSQSVVSEARRRNLSRGRHTTSIRSKSRGRMSSTRDDDDKSVVSRTPRSKSRARVPGMKPETGTLRKEPSTRGVGRHSSINSTGSDSKSLKRTPSVNGRRSLSRPAVGESRSSDEESDEDGSSGEVDSDMESDDERTSGASTPKARGRSVGRRTTAEGSVRRGKSASKLTSTGGEDLGSRAVKQSVHRSRSRPKVKTSDSQDGDGKVHKAPSDELPGGSTHSQTDKSVTEIDGAKAEASEENATSPKSKKRTIGSRISALKSAFRGGNRADAAESTSDPSLERGASSTFPSVPHQKAGEETIENHISRRPSISRRQSTEWSEIDFTALQNGQQPTVAAVVRVGSLLGGDDDDIEDFSESNIVEDEPAQRNPVQRTPSNDSIPRKIERKKSFLRDDSSVRNSSTRPDVSSRSSKLQIRS